MGSPVGSFVWLFTVHVNEAQQLISERENLLEELVPWRVSHFPVAQVVEL